MSKLMRITALFAILSVGTAEAEVGIGAIENPDGTYTEEIIQDWQEGITPDVSTGDYIITYKSEDGSFAQVIFEPATKIDPILKSKFKAERNTGVVSYEYKLKNGSKAKRPINQLITYVSTGSPTHPSEWHGLAIPDGVIPGLRLSWFHVGKDIFNEKPGGLLPGRNLRGFAIESHDLPGIAIVEIYGARRTTAWLGLYDVASTVGQQIEDLKKRDFIPLPAAVPKIPVPAPFDAAAILNSLNKHLDEDLVAMKLTDPVFAGQLGRLLGSAAEAARRGDTENVRRLIKDLRHHIKKEYEDIDEEEDGDKDDERESGKGKTSPLIDKLAARVLDFDLKYIDKRLKKQDD